MKRFFIFVLLTFLPIIFFSSCTTMDKLQLRSLYSIEQSSISDIQGDIQISDMVIYKNIRIGGSEIIQFGLIEREVKSYFFELYYSGGYWKFIEELDLKIDGQMFSIVDKDPSRNVITSGVSERLNFYLSEELINAIKDCSTIVLQYQAGSPVVLKQEAISALKDFLK